MQAGTASSAISAVGTQIALDTGRNQPQLEGTQKFTPRLDQVIAGWRKSNSPVVKKMPVEADVPEEIARWGRARHATELLKAVGDLALIAFYFLLCIGEYTTKHKSNATKQTQQFHVRDVRFFADKGNGVQRQLPPDAPDEDLLSATSATLCLGNQNNGWKRFAFTKKQTGASISAGSRHWRAGSFTSART